MGSTKGDCTFPECGAPIHAKGLCRPHNKQRLAGVDLRPLKRVASPEDRFWSRVDKGSGPEGCWEWTGLRLPTGYGQMSVRGKVRRMHRYSYELAHGPISEGAFIGHLCHNPACVNPAHLREATPGLNAQNRRGARAGSKSGIRGVVWHKGVKKWAAQAHLNGKRVHLGLFEDKEEAGEAASAWRREHMPYSAEDQEPAGSFFMPETTKEGQA